MSLNEISFLYISEAAFAAITDCIRNYNEVAESGCDEELLYRMRKFYFLKAHSYVDLWADMTADFSNEKLRNDNLKVIEEMMNELNH